MPSKNVAVEGDVQAIVGTAMITPAETGTWTAGSITESSYNKLKIEETKVIYKVECTFTFSGSYTPPGGTPTAVSGSETVTLTANSTKLQNGFSNVLVNGDSAEGTYGNKLQVVTSNKLLSA